MPQRKVGQRSSVGQRAINNAKAMNRVNVAAFGNRSGTASAFCGAGVGDPGDCTLYNPPEEEGFPGSIVEMMGGTTLMDPATCGDVEAPDHSHTLGGLSNVSGTADCPDDGDVLMWRAGTGTKPGEWVPAKLEEFFARACRELTAELSDVDCAAALSAFSSSKSLRAARSTRSAPPPVVRAAGNARSTSSAAAAAPTSKTYGAGTDGDVTLDSDSELATDMYFNNLKLNGHTLNTNGYRLFVGGTLDAGRKASTGATGSIVCDGFNGTTQGVGKGGPSGTLGGGADGNATITYSISGSAGSDGKGHLGPAAELVSELEGGLNVLSELDTAVRMRALDGRRLTGGAGGVGERAGGGGGVLFVAARNTALGGTLRARGGSAGGAESGAGGGGAVVFIHSGPTTWQFDVSGGDHVATAGKVFDIRA